MRWSIIRLIFFRELRDQLRDRRTIFMIAVLPVLLYPVLGVAVMQFAVGFADKPSVIGIVGSDHLPPSKPTSAGQNPLPLLAWLRMTPGCAGAAIPVDGIAGAAALSRAATALQAYPPLLVRNGLPTSYFETAREARSIHIEVLSADQRSALENKQVDLLLIVPSNFHE
jgi:hypothetical protein